MRYKSYWLKVKFGINEIGGFSEVWSAIDKCTGQSRAVKITQKSLSSNEETYAEMEFEILNKLVFY